MSAALGLESPMKRSRARSFRAEEPGRVLVLYTGGTVGMAVEDGVYIPRADFLTENLRKIPTFHDTSHDIQHDPRDKLAFPSDMPLISMPAKSTKRVYYIIKEYSPLLDSSNMGHAEYVKIASEIRQHYELFDGFVVLHGTDTMAYTASALSFMLENLGKPVILTGAQVPIIHLLSDGRDNFLGALVLAAHYTIPEVCLYFDNKLYRGCRVVKAHSSSLSGFQSPNMPALAEVGTHIHVNWDCVWSATALRKFTLHTTMSRNVALLRIFPGITTEVIRAFTQPPIEGVVLQTYGAGNGPTDQEDFLKVIKEATDRGVIILNITQCYQGAVEGAYATGRLLIDAGVVPGSDMTPEAALMKLSYVLSKKAWSVAEKKKFCEVSLRGELTSIRRKRDLAGNTDILAAIIQQLPTGSQAETDALRHTLGPALLCLAAQGNSAESLESLINTGVSVHGADYDGRTPLHLASSWGNVDATRFLLGKGALVHVKDRFGHTPLLDAVRGKHLDVIRLLRQAGAHFTHNPRLAHEVAVAVGTDDLLQVTVFAEAGINFNWADFNGITPLHVAVERNKLMMVEYLLSHGADTSTERLDGVTPLDLAYRSQTLASLREIVVAAAQTEHADSGNVSPK